jgi:hypothetical protein
MKAAHGQCQTFDMTPRFSVDFNELLERDLIMLSQTDLREDINGSPVLLVEGLPVEVQEENLYDDGTHEVLFARGVVEANSTGTWSHVKWCCRFDADGFSDIAG